MFILRNWGEILWLVCETRGAVKFGADSGPTGFYLQTYFRVLFFSKFRHSSSSTIIANVCNNLLPFCIEASYFYILRGYWCEWDTLQSVCEYLSPMVHIFALASDPKTGLSVGNVSGIELKDMRNTFPTIFSKQGEHYFEVLLDEPMTLRAGLPSL